MLSRQLLEYESKQAKSFRQSCIRRSSRKMWRDRCFGHNHTVQWFHFHFSLNAEGPNAKNWGLRRFFCLHSKCTIITFDQCRLAIPLSTWREWWEWKRIIFTNFWGLMLIWIICLFVENVDDYTEDVHTLLAQKETTPAILSQGHHVGRYFIGAEEAVVIWGHKALLYQPVRVLSKTRVECAVVLSPCMPQTGSLPTVPVPVSGIHR